MGFNRHVLLIGLITLLGAYLRFNRLGDHDNSYYTATVASMMANFHNFIYASFDPLGFVMVDKPPLSFWPQIVSAFVFGLTRWSVTVPQALIGTVSVPLLYMAVAPVFGRRSALISSVILAIVPANVLLDSRNEPDSLLSLFLLIAAILIVRSVNTGKFIWLLLFGLVMGLAFNTKMLVAFVPLPIFIAYYILSCNYSYKKMFIRISAMLTLLLTVSMVWVSLILYTPVEDRPFVGSTRDNSILTLIFEYNGLDRFTSFIGPRFNVPPPRYLDEVNTRNITPDSVRQFQQIPGNYRMTSAALSPVGSSSRFGDLLKYPMAAQLGWLLPAGFILCIAVMTSLLKIVYWRFTNLNSVFFGQRSSAETFLWYGWLVISVIVFGSASSTTTHPYYLIGVSIPLSATVGIGISRLLEMRYRKVPGLWVLILFVSVVVGYQVFGSYGHIDAWMSYLPVFVLSWAVIISQTHLLKKQSVNVIADLGKGLVVISLFLIPLYVSLTTTGLMNRPVERMPDQLYTTAQFQGSRTIDRISKAVSRDTGANSAVTLGTVNARAAAPFIRLGLSAFAIGGFSGNDPVFNLESFKIMVHRDKMGYFLMPYRGPVQNPRGMNQESILTYIRNNWDDISGKWGLPKGSAYANPDL